MPEVTQEVASRSHGRNLPFGIVRPPVAIARLRGLHSQLTRPIDHHASTPSSRLHAGIMLTFYPQAYHSAFNEDPDVRQVGNMAVLPIKTKFRGPAPLGMHALLSILNICTQLSWCPADYTQADIIDETLDLFRANSLFRNFEIKGPADRLLIVLILFVSDCLAKIGSARTVPNQLEANKTLNTLAVDNFPIPGDANFPLNAHYAPPASRADAGATSTFLLHQCCAVMRDTTCRLSATVPHSGTARTCCPSRGEAVRRRHGQTEQVVDVLPEEAFHEQERRLRGTADRVRISKDVICINPLDPTACY